MKKSADFTFLCIVSGAIVYLLYQAMQNFGYGWFDEQTAGITWACVMSVLFVLR